MHVRIYSHEQLTHDVAITASVILYYGILEIIITISTHQYAFRFIFSQMYDLMSLFIYVLTWITRDISEGVVTSSGISLASERAALSASSEKYCAQLAGKDTPH